MAWLAQLLPDWITGIPEEDDERDRRAAVVKEKVDRVVEKTQSAAALQRDRWENESI